MDPYTVFYAAYGAVEWIKTWSWAGFVEFGLTHKYTPLF